MALDAAFQLMILWCFEARGVGSLPVGAASYRQFVKAFPKEGVRIVASITEARELSVAAGIEFVDAGGKLLARMEGYECVMDGTLVDSFALNQLAD